jgi:hypothetical protein
LPPTEPLPLACGPWWVIYYQYFKSSLVFKTGLSIQDQIRRLQERGMIFNNIEMAEILSLVTFFRERNIFG